MNDQIEPKPQSIKSLAASFDNLANQFNQISMRNHGIKMESEALEKKLKRITKKLDEREHEIIALKVLIERLQEKLDATQSRSNRLLLGFLCDDQKILSKEFPKELKELDGKLFDYHAYRTPVIYFLIRNNQVTYVGQSIDVGGRISQHRKSRKKFDRVVYVRVEEGELNSTESYFIKALKPEDNLTGRGPE